MHAVARVDALQCGSTGAVMHLRLAGFEGVVFELEPVALASNRGFTANELGRIRRIIKTHLERMTDAWREHCNPA